MSESNAKAGINSGRFQLPIRKLEFGNIFTAGFNIYKYYFLQLAGLFLLLYLPHMLFLTRFWPMYLALTQGAGAVEAFHAEIGYLIISGILLLSYFLLVYPLILLVPVRLAGLAYLGIETTVWDCVKFAWRRWLITQSSYALFGLLIIGLFMLPLLAVYISVIPALLFVGLILSMLFLALAFIGTLVLIIMISPMSGVIAFEQTEGSLYARSLNNVKRAFSLSLPNFWYLLGILILTWLLMSIIRYLISAPVSVSLMIMTILGSEKSINISSVMAILSNPPTWVSVGSM